MKQERSLSPEEARLLWRIAEALYGKHYSQELAEMSGVHFRTILRWRTKGDKWPPPERLMTRLLPVARARKQSISGLIAQIEEATAAAKAKEGWESAG